MSQFVLPVSLESLRQVMAEDPMAAWINFHLDEVRKDYVLAHMLVEEKHVAPNNFMHASAIMAFADITSGMGTAICLPDTDHLFATLEIKTNFMGTTHAGTLICEAVPKHIGGSTHVWDAEVKRQDDKKTIALFRCTQMILPRTR